jgi:hypothetical protein
LKNVLKIQILSGIFLLCLQLNCKTLNGQILKDPRSLKLVKEAVDHIYNLHFDEARYACNRINSIYPGHPVVSLLRGMIIYWDNYPLLSSSKAQADFEYQIHACIEKCDKHSPGNETEFLLAGLCARGISLMFYTDNNLYSRILPLAGSTYRNVRRAFNHTSESSDLYFYTGLYNYYREVYPAAHPLYRPIYFLFPAGDRQKGLRELQTAFEESIFMKAEASSYLSSGYKYFENDFPKAAGFSKTLYRNYPLNYIYRARCIEDLLLSHQYDEAERLLSSGNTISNTFYQAQLMIFRAILDEKKYHDMNSAEKGYLEGARAIASYGNYGAAYAAYAWFGLSRISALRNDRQNEKTYRRKALELTDFGQVNFDN